jgi:glutamate-ammonia-ligase adenylyltransferase
MLVSSLQAFDEYQHNQAWTWEHQALVRARAVAGDPRLVERFGVIRREVLCLKRDTQALRHDVREMRLRMWEQVTARSEDRFDLKKDPGGIIDIEFMVQYQVLANAHQHPCLADYTDNNRILEGLENCGLLLAQDAQSMREIYRIFRDRAHELSLQGEPSIVNRSEFILESAEIKRLWRAMLDTA